MTDLAGGPVNAPTFFRQMPPTCETGGHTYSRSMNQKYPRLCVKCREPEARREPVRTPIEPPNPEKCSVELFVSCEAVPMVRYMLPPNVQIVDCTPVEDDIRTWRFVLLVPEWPYEGRTATAIITVEPLSKKLELVSALPQKKKVTLQ